jgi:hypothetical protein
MITKAANVSVPSRDSNRELANFKYGARVCALAVIITLRQRTRGREAAEIA